MSKDTGQTNGEHETTLYDASSEVRNWGDAWCGPTHMVGGQEYVIARFEAAHDDGHSVEVRCAAYPARFYRIVSEGAGIDLNTGSGMSRLAKEIAQAIAGGMLVHKR